MGLDMYLFRTKKGTDVKTADAVLNEVMYWRKANQIRGWFDRNIEGGCVNCEMHLLSEPILIALVDTCKEVLEDNSKADDLLPTTQGFFFGGYEYDDWYFADLNETVIGLTKIIDETDWDTEDIYYHEWW